MSNSTDRFVGIVRGREGTTLDCIRSNEISLAYHAKTMDRRLHGLMFLIAWLTAVSYLVLSCACASTAAKNPTFTRSIPNEHAASVLIGEMCNGMPSGVGSGVIIDDHHVLTAHHVIAGTAKGCIYILRTLAGADHAIVVVKDWPDHDVAEVATVTDALPYTKVTIGHVPPVGELACVVPANPYLDRRCGRVQFYGTDNVQGTKLTGAHEFDAVVMPGNSGAGTYDERGHLIGITLATYKCPGVDQYCGGLFADLEFLAGK